MRIQTVPKGLFCVLGLFFFGILVPAYSQQYSNSNSIIGDKLNEQRFMFEVKLIEEFIERFNDVSSTLRRQFPVVMGTGLPFSSSDMRLSLFNLRGKKFSRADTLLIFDFLKSFGDTTQAYLLSKADTNFFVEIRAHFTVNKKQDLVVPLVLRAQVTPDGGAYWIIAGVGDFYKGHAKIGYRRNYDSVSWDDSKYIPMNAQTNYFSGFSEILVSGIEPQYYFTQEFMGTSKGSNFIQHVDNGVLKFAYVDKMRFRFFVNNRWAFSVDYIQRKHFNSGWLINDLKSINCAEKDAFIRQLLFPVKDNQLRIYPSDSVVMKLRAGDALADLNELSNFVLSKRMLKAQISNLIRYPGTTALKWNNRNIKIVGYQTGSPDTLGLVNYLSKIAVSPPNCTKKIVQRIVSVSDIFYDGANCVADVSFTEAIAECKSGVASFSEKRVRNVVAHMKFRKFKNNWVATIDGLKYNN